MDELSGQEIQSLKDTLLNLRCELTEQLEISEASSKAVELDQTAVGRVSRMDAMQQQSMALSTRRKANTKLVKVDLALAAIANSTYGWCRNCDESIGYGRLKIQPESSLCLVCQSMSDQK
ncbi:MAG: TraR/DksA family transcriptional regulator [Pseudohongiellaceae bacterium]